MNNNEDIKQIERLIANHLGQINISYGCEVVKVTKKRVKVKILATDFKATGFPSVFNVPVMTLRGGNSLISLPVAIGDKGLIIFSSKPTQQFLTGQGNFPVADFDVDNAFYFGGIFVDGEDDASFSTDALVVKKGDSKIEVFDDKIDITAVTVNVNSTTVNVNSTDANVTASNEANIDAPTVNIAGGGDGIAREGDEIEVVIPSGSSAGTYTGTITTSSTKGFCG